MKMAPLPTGPHAPEGDIALARAALLRFGGSQGLPTDTNGYLTWVARQYNIELTCPTRKQAVNALSWVSATAKAYAYALHSLNERLPGYLNFEALQRLPDGSTRPTTAGEVLLSPSREPIRDDLQVALAPELAVPLHMRPEDILGPTAERAAAMARLFGEHRKKYEGALKTTAPGRLNVERDGRSAKRMLVEACYFVVAGLFGMTGTAKIMTKNRSDAPKDKRKVAPSFVNFVKAMHVYARKSRVSERGFERSLDNMAAIEAFLSEHPQLYGFVPPYDDGAAEYKGKQGANIFFRRLTDPAALPMSKSAS